MHERQSLFAAMEQLESQAPLPPHEGAHDLAPPSAADGREYERQVTQETANGLRALEWAAHQKRPLTSSLIDASIHQRSIQLGDTHLTLGQYLASAVADQSDREAIRNPHAIGALHAATLSVVARNLHVMYRPGVPGLAGQLEHAVHTYTNDLADSALGAGRALHDWCTLRNDTRPGTMELRGLVIAGEDILDGKNNSGDLLSNMHVTRTDQGTTLHAVSYAQHIRQAEGRDRSFDRTIFLNPRADATAGIFEALLTTANRDGCVVAIDMVDRAHEFSEAYYQLNAGHSSVDVVQGNAIALHVQESDAARMLGCALKLAEQSPELFAGRRTGRVPQYVTDGISVGDVPVGSSLSLTEHREHLFIESAARIQTSPLAAEEHDEAYRLTFKHIAHNWQVHGENIAFNQH